MFSFECFCGNLRSSVHHRLPNDSDCRSYNGCGAMMEKPPQMTNRFLVCRFSSPSPSLSISSVPTFRRRHFFLFLFFLFSLIVTLVNGFAETEPSVETIFFRLATNRINVYRRRTGKRRCEIVMSDILFFPRSFVNRTLLVLHGKRHIFNE